MIEELKYDKNTVTWKYNNIERKIEIRNIWRAKYSNMQDIIAIEHNEYHKTNVSLYTPTGKFIKKIVSIPGRKIVGLAKFGLNDKIQLKVTYENEITYICEYSRILDDIEKIRKA